VDVEVGGNGGGKGIGSGVRRRRSDGLVGGAECVK
jgi:hypothetical protein